MKEINITFIVDHDTGYPNMAFLVGEYNGQRFVQEFNKNSWFNFSLRFAKHSITQKFNIIYKGKK